MGTSGGEKSDKYWFFLYREGEKNTKWRLGAPPSYDIVNKLFEEGKVPSKTRSNTLSRPSRWSSSTNPSLKITSPLIQPSSPRVSMVIIF